MLLFIGFFLGVYCYDLYFSAEIWKILVFLLIFLFFWVRGFEKRNLYLFLLGLFIAFFRMNFLDYDVVSLNVDSFEACVVREVDVREKVVKYTVESEVAEGLILVNGPRYPVYKYGDCLKVFGKVEVPESNAEFDYRAYLRRYGVYYLVQRANGVNLIDRGDESLLGEIYALKFLLQERLNKLFSEPHASFMSGLLLGSRKGIPSDLLSDFERTGLTHIIAISGYNITILVLMVSAVFSFLTRKKRVIVSIIFIVLFVVLVGMGAAVLRAGLMGVLALLAVYFGREYFVTWALFLAAFLMTFWNPFILLDDLGFQLSFLATGGLIYFSPLLEKYFKFLPEFMMIRESALMTISAQVLALPLIVLSFERLSLIAPIANIFVLPLIPIAMLLGALAIIFGEVFAFFAYLILELVVFLVKFFAELPFALVEVEGLSWLMVLFYYLICCYSILFVKPT